MKSVKNFIPNLLTLCNLFCGVLGIYFCYHEALVWSAILIFIGAFFDFFDGLVARLLGAHSELGKQLDSLADLVTFGVLPGTILFNLILASQGFYFNQFNEIPIQQFILATSGLLIPLFGALRLAKFNIDNNQVEGFLGVPIPAPAIYIAGLPLVIEWQYQLNLYSAHNVDEFIALSQLYFWNNTDILLMLFVTNKWFYVFSAIGLSLLMVIPLPIISFKFKSLKWSLNKWRYSFLLIAFVSICLAFIHDVVFIEQIPYLQWIIVPLLVMELVIWSIFKNLFSSSGK